MEHSRHIVLDGPSNEDAQIQIYDYGNTVTVWVGYSPEVFEPKEDKSLKNAVDKFIALLLENSYKIISEGLIPV